MSVELIQKYYNHFNNHEFDQMAACLDENVVHELNEGEAQRGLSKFKDFMKVMDIHYSEQVKELCVLESKDKTRFAAEFFIDGAYTKTQAPLPQASNQKYYIRVGAFFEVKNNKITRITNHYNLQNWINVVNNYKA